MPKQDRGAPPRPPWLPEEDEQRGFLRSLRRKKRNPDEGEPNDESLTHETERPSAPKTAAQKPSAESVKLSGQGRPTLTSGEESADGHQPVSDLSKYYTPPRRAEPAGDPSSASESIAVPGPVAEPDTQAPRIIRGASSDVAPEPEPMPQVEQLSSSAPVESSAMPEQELEVPAPNPVAESAPVVTGEPEPPLQAAATPEVARPVVPRSEQPATGPERAVVDSDSADPFSRFSLLEAQLRQMSLDESITDDELERHRRHAAPEAEPATAPAAALSFTPPEVVASIPDDPAEALEETQAAVESPSEEPAPAPTLGFTAPEPEDDVPAVDQEAVGAGEESEAAVTAVTPVADQPEPNSAGNEPATAQAPISPPRSPRRVTIAVTRWCRSLSPSSSPRQRKLWRPRRRRPPPAVVTPMREPPPCCSASRPDAPNSTRNWPRTTPPIRRPAHPNRNPPPSCRWWRHGPRCPSRCVHLRRRLPHPPTMPMKPPTPRRPPAALLSWRDLRLWSTRTS